MCAGELGVSEYRNFMSILHYTLWTRLLLLLGKSFSWLVQKQEFVGIFVK